MGSNILIQLVSFYLLLPFSFQLDFDQKWKKKIGIIGAGIGGTASAYFLRQKSEQNQELDLSIDLFEAYQVGGRAKNIEIGGKLYEAGGSIIHPANLYLQQFVDKFGLKHRDTRGLTDRFGLYNGNELVFTESKWGSLATLLKMVYRYGYNLFRLYWRTKNMLSKFSRIYNLQLEAWSFDSLTELMREMSPDFLEEMEKDLNRSMLEAGFSQTFIDELVSAAVIVNYGQKITVPAFVGNVAVAGAESGLWSVSGGNENVPQALLRHSGANLISRNVEEVVLDEKENKYTVMALDEKGNSNNFSDYDCLIIAFPLIKNRKTKVKFSGIKAVEEAYGTFHRTVATFVKGQPRFSNWCPNGNEGDCPTDIFGCGSNWGSYYNSLGQLAPVDYQNGDTLPEKQQRVWKVFSDAPLSEKQMKQLFEVVVEKKEIPWLAYPDYSKSSFPKSLNFRLRHGLYYVNSIEWAASALEMSVIAAKNVALLVAKDILDAGTSRTKPAKSEIREKEL